MEFSSGSENLSVMKDAPRYLNYIATLVNKHLPKEGVIIDFGAGNGLQSSFVRKPNDKYVCVENNPQMQDELRGRGYTTRDTLKSFEADSVAAVVSINCLEHIKGDQGVIREIHDLLEKNGKVIIYVPALPFLYSDMDRKVGHYRRYTKKTLSALFQDSEFEINALFSVDLLGIFATILYKYLPTRNSSTESQGLKFYDRFLVPATIFFDRILGYRFGKNLLIVATKR
jgi:SAM-dependent methyltransferase